MTTGAPDQRRRGWMITLGICLALAIIGFVLLTEHQAHVLGILPYLLLAACPLSHLLMHRGHRHGSGPGGHDREAHGRHGGEP